MCWANRMLVCGISQIDPYVSSCTIVKSKCNKDLNEKPNTVNTVNQIEEKMENILNALTQEINFMNKTEITQALRPTIKKGT